MSDEAYNPIADVSRYLQTPPPESHNILAAPGDEPVASHVVGAPQDVHVPAVQMGVAPAPLEAPPLLNPDPAFGLPPPAPTNSVENNQDVQPPPQAYGFPDDPVPAPAAMASNDDPVASFEGLFDDIVLPNLETMSLSDDDWFMDDGDDDEVEALIRSIEDTSGNTDMGSGVAEHTAVPRVEEDYYLNFVPFVHGELDCSNCRSVREMLHESANHKLHFDVHVTDPETFQHAIFDRTYIDANGQTVLNEMVYLDFRQSTHEWVHNVIANCVEMLKNDTSGQLKNSCSTSSAAVCTNNDDPHRKMEMDMLKEIFSSHTAPTEAVAPQFAPETPQPATPAEQNTNANDILLDAANRTWAGLGPAILESYQVTGQEGESTASATDNNLLAKQRKRISDVNMEDILKCIHMSKKDAAKELNISATSLKRLCRKYNTHRWPARKIISINNKIKKLEQAAQRNVGMSGLLAFKEKLDKLKLEKKQLYASILNGTYEKEKPNGGAGPSGASSR
ncbi:unnamed protein product [Urochloa decumbens]|uniref:RWP-RK domain-containing protein n=1 Tax=Urochloa decumbens TaxID=240449 RepID=A0ABC9A1R3_9POAL